MAVGTALEVERMQGPKVHRADRPGTPVVSYGSFPQRNDHLWH